MKVPRVDGPGVDGPGVDAPGVDAPGVDAPGVDAPGADAPGADSLGVDSACKALCLCFTPQPIRFDQKVFRQFVVQPVCRRLPG